MRDRGFDVTALASPGEALTRFSAELGLPVAAVEMPRRVSPIRDLWAIWRIVSLLREVRPSIVHAHTPKGGLLGMIASYLVRVPIRVYHLRGLPLMSATGMRRILLRGTEMVSCQLADRVICVSHSLREVAIQEGVCPSAKITVLGAGSGQGVDGQDRFNPGELPPGSRQDTRSRFGIPEDVPVAGFVGRLVRDKGVAELVEAWTRLRKEYSDLHLLLVGPFEIQDSIPIDARRILEEDPRVHLAGMDWNTPPLYAAMDLLVLPTYREGFPNAPLEAAAMELPVVATQIPGCVDAVEEGVTGTLVPVRDSEALANAVAMYLDDPELCRRHGRAGRQRVLKEFRPEAIWELLFAEYRELMSERGLPMPGSDHTEAHG